MKKLFVGLTLLFIAPACDSVTFVDRLTIVNPTEYSVVVDVKGANDASWLLLGIVDRNSETVREQVVDMGGRIWNFRFHYGGEGLGEETISRSRLEQQRWRYTIPERVGNLLKEKGYEPSLK